MNGCYIREMGAEKLAQRAKEWLAKAVCLGKLQVNENGGNVVATPPKDAASAPLPKFSESELAEAKNYVEAHTPQMVAACQNIIERIDRLDEIPEKLSFLFWGNQVVMDEKSLNKVLLKENARADEALNALREVIANESWDFEALQNAASALCENLSIKPRLLFQPLRVAVCGNMVSPPLMESIALMNREDVLDRIDFALKLIAENK